MKINGEEAITPRGANKKYHQLDDLDLLYELLQKKCIADVAKDLDVPPESIRYRVIHYFPEEWEANIKRKRRPHTKNRTCFKKVQ